MGVSSVALSFTPAAAPGIVPSYLVDFSGDKRLGSIQCLEVDASALSTTCYIQIDSTLQQIFRIPPGVVTRFNVPALQSSQMRVFLRESGQNLQFLPGGLPIQFGTVVIQAKNYPDFPMGMSERAGVTYRSIIFGPPASTLLIWRRPDLYSTIIRKMRWTRINGTRFTPLAAQAWVSGGPDALNKFIVDQNFNVQLATVAGDRKSVV